MSSTIYFKPQYIRDKKIFKQLFSDYYAPLCLFADKYIKDMDLSKDLVQGVFVKLWEKNVSITLDVTVKSFLYVTVRNACLNHIRQKMNEEKKIFDYVDVDSDSIFDYNMLEEDVFHKLYKAVDQLSPRYKEAILLTINEYSNKEIAEQMQISINSVKTLKQRSYKLLRLKLATLILLLCPFF